MLLLLSSMLAAATSGCLVLLMLLLMQRPHRRRTGCVRVGADWHAPALARPLLDRVGPRQHCGLQGCRCV
jgi:hypothetical protein